MIPKNTFVAILIHVLLGFLVLIQNVFYFSIEILKYEIILIWIWDIISYVRLKKSFNLPYIYFLATFFFFILSRVFGDIMGLLDFSLTTGFSQYKYSLYVQGKILVNLIIALWATQLGVFLSVRKSSVVTNVDFDHSDKLYKYGLGLFIFTLPFVIFDFFKKVMAIKKYGYLALFQDFNESPALIVILCIVINTIGLYFIILSKPDKKKMLWILSLYISFLLVKLSLGQRGAILCQMITIFWAITYVYNVKINFLKITFFSCLILLLAFYVGISRVDGDFSIGKDALGVFFMGQGVSIQVLGYSIEYENLLSDYSFINMFAELRSIFESILNRLLGTESLITNSAYESMKAYGHLGLKLSYLVHTDKFFKGNGLGTSYIAEIYLVAKEYGQLYFGIILGFIIEYLSRLTVNSKKGMLLLLVLSPSLYFLSRDSLFAFLSNNILIVGLLIFIFFFKPNVYKQLK
ncbi:MAG: O-antigen polysaccharide polymerase Wzy [Marinifilaceae bacterium]|nr:O-antigen polysaccharide polymerase Wzy [Marinifilaceae bacterium]